MLQGAKKTLRDNNIKVEMYPDAKKMNKQMKYANDKNIPFVAIIGDKEIDEQVILVKNMLTGDQQNYSLENLIELLK